MYRLGWGVIQPEMDWLVVHHFKWYQKFLQKQDGCDLVSLSSDFDEPTRILILERWQHKNCLDKVERKPQYTALSGRIASCLIMPLRIEFFGTLLTTELSVSGMGEKGKEL